MTGKYSLLALSGSERLSLQELAQVTFQGEHHLQDYQQLRNGTRAASSPTTAPHRDVQRSNASQGSRGRRSRRPKPWRFRHSTVEQDVRRSRRRLFAAIAAAPAAARDGELLPAARRRFNAVRLHAQHDVHVREQP